MTGMVGAIAKHHSNLAPTIPTTLQRVNCRPSLQAETDAV